MLKWEHRIVVKYIEENVDQSKCVHSVFWIQFITNETIELFLFTEGGVVYVKIISRLLIILPNRCYSSCKVKQIGMPFEHSPIQI